MRQRLKRAVKAFVKELFFPGLIIDPGNTTQQETPAMQKETVSEREFFDYLEKIVQDLQDYYTHAKDIAGQQLDIHGKLLTAVKIYRKQRGAE